ncbi:prepilin-type N-terminal cleavage/methylation domain-containing protein [Candidatus Sumerlaeota bacterium]|nr:prepilin-type N-terminal cleavage/methylation domain-containing protein [Candidatus Sumerlaeota bacterium]
MEATNKERRPLARAFTLIELLIVVAIIAILAAIAVPNFLEAQVRSKVARVQNDMRSLSVALEAYRVDWDAIPYWHSWVGTTAASRTVMRPGYFWIALSTPVAYLSKPIEDAFVYRGVHSQSVHAPGDGDLLDPYIQVHVGYVGPVIANAGKTEYVGVSYGPDSADDTGGGGGAGYPYTRFALPYDPTNGTASWGDIYRHGGRVPVNFIAGKWPTGGHGSNVTGAQGVGDPYRWAN